MAEVLTIETDRPAAPGIAGESDTEARVRRLKSRFLQVWNHSLWRRYRKESKEDMGFHSGVGHWPEAVKKKLETEERAALSLNQIRPVVSVVVGYERQSRMDIRPLPEGEEDLENVSLLGRIMKRVQQDQEVEYVMSEGFKDGVIGGLAAWFLGVDYTEDPIHGQITVEKVKSADIVWDPDWQKYDLSDARDLFWHKMVSVDILKAQYPDAADRIDRAISLLQEAKGPDPVEIPAQDPSDAYKTSLDAISFYDATANELRVLDCWYRTWDTVHLLVDKARNTVTEIPEGSESLAVAKALVDGSEDVKVDGSEDVKVDGAPALKIVKRQRRKVEECVILPAAGVELERGNPFENDDAEYPFVPFIAYREGDEILGIVRNLKDPQREINKRRSAMVDNASHHGHMTWKMTRNALENPEALETPSASTVFIVKQGATFEEMTPPAMPAWVAGMDEQAKVEIREISGVNAPLQGQAAAGDSGIKVARLQQQGQIITSELFDNYRRSRRILGKRLAKRVQQVFTGPMTVRLQADSGESEFVTINQQEADEKGRITVVRDIPSLKYDVQISDTPSTPTARAMGLAVLMELIQAVPSLAPALADIIIEMTDIPNREKVLQRIRAITQAGAQPPSNGRPSGVAGSPAGAPATAPAGVVA